MVGAGPRMPGIGRGRGAGWLTVGALGRYMFEVMETPKNWRQGGDTCTSRQNIHTVCTYAIQFSSVQQLIYSGEAFGYLQLLF